MDVITASPILIEFGPQIKSYTYRLPNQFVSLPISDTRFPKGIISCVFIVPSIDRFPFKDASPNKFVIPETYNFELKLTSSPTKSLLFIETSSIMVVLPLTINLLLSVTSDTTFSLLLKDTSFITINLELNLISPPTIRFVFNETSPSEVSLYPVFDKITFLSMLVVSVKS